MEVVVSDKGTVRPLCSDLHVRCPCPSHVYSVVVLFSQLLGQLPPPPPTLYIA